MRLLKFVVCLALLGCITPATAQTPAEMAPGSAYPRGAGAYFAGRFDQAAKYLTTAIQDAPDDPRGYYLRGLSYLATGDTLKAQADLNAGAQLEARMGSSWPLVDRSLASVQGSPRRTLERIRRAARESAEIQEMRSLAMARKKVREERENHVLRTDYRLPMEALASRLTIDQARRVAVTDRSATANQLAGGDATNAETAAAANPEVAQPSNPFADDAYDESKTYTATTAPGGDFTTSSEVPAGARGSVKAGSLFGIFSRMGNRAVGNVGAKASDLAGQAMGAAGGSSPFDQGAADPGDFQQGGFDEGDFGERDANSGDFEANPFGGMDAEEGAPAMQEGDNPFQFGE